VLADRGGVGRDLHDPESREEQKRQQHDEEVERPDAQHPPHVKAAHIDRAGDLFLDEQQIRDQVSAQHEEERHRESSQLVQRRVVVSAREAVVLLHQLDVAHGHGHRREETQAVEPGKVHAALHDRAPRRCIHVRNSVPMPAKVL
jgi:hypothetical protein